MYATTSPPLFFVIIIVFFFNTFFSFFLLFFFSYFLYELTLSLIWDTRKSCFFVLLRPDSLHSCCARSHAIFISHLQRFLYFLFFAYRGASITFFLFFFYVYVARLRSSMTLKRPGKKDRRTKKVRALFLVSKIVIDRRVVPSDTK